VPLTTNPTKLGLHFFDLSTIFYRIYKNHQNTCTIWDEVLHRGPWKVFQIHNHAPGSRITPWKERGRCNWVLGHGGRRFWPKSGEPAARVAGERAGRWRWTHHASVWGRKRGGDGVGELARWHRAAAAAVVALRWGSGDSDTTRWGLSFYVV
jgi:hypothetical protein